MNDDTLQNLSNILEQRKHANSDESYVASLYEAGLKKILGKINVRSKGGNRGCIRR